jgi:hypothetical protein
MLETHSPTVSNPFSILVQLSDGDAPVIQTILVGSYQTITFANLNGFQTMIQVIHTDYGTLVGVGRGSGKKEAKRQAASHILEQISACELLEA